MAIVSNVPRLNQLQLVNAHNVFLNVLIVLIQMNAHLANWDIMLIILIVRFVAQLVQQIVQSVALVLPNVHRA